MSIHYRKSAINFFTSISLSFLVLCGCSNASSEPSSSNQFEYKNNVSEGETITEEQAKEEDVKSEYVPRESDIVYKDNEIVNVHLLEEFMEIAGTDNESKIRVVIDHSEKGVIVYTLYSRYNSSQDSGGIDVIPDMSNYTPSDDEVEHIFNYSPQQCEYLEKDYSGEQGYYKLFECVTNWQFPLLPILED